MHGKIVTYLEDFGIKFDKREKESDLFSASIGSDLYKSLPDINL